MKLNARERALAARYMLLFENGRAKIKTASGKLGLIEPNYMNVNRQYFTFYLLDEDLNHETICTRATLETILKKAETI